MSAQPIRATPSSSPAPLVQGTWSYQKMVDDYVASIDSIIEDAINSALVFAKADLIRTARQAEGWKDLALYLTVEWDGEGFVYSAHPSVMLQVNHLEYGDKERTPTGFLRKTAIRQAPLLAKIVSSTMSGSFGE